MKTTLQTTKIANNYQQSKNYIKRAEKAILMGVESGKMTHNQQSQFQLKTNNPILARVVSIKNRLKNLIKK